MWFGRDLGVALETILAVVTGNNDNRTIADNVGEVRDVPNIRIDIARNDYRLKKDVAAPTLVWFAASGASQSTPPLFEEDFINNHGEYNLGTKYPRGALCI